MKLGRVTLDVEVDDLAGDEQVRVSGEVVGLLHGIGRTLLLQQILPQLQLLLQAQEPSLIHANRRTVLLPLRRPGRGSQLHVLHRQVRSVAIHLPHVASLHTGSHVPQYLLPIPEVLSDPLRSVVLLVFTPPHRAQRTVLRLLFRRCLLSVLLR